MLQAVFVKIADFGFAKEDKGDLMTPQFTPYYVSPQVLLELCLVLLICVIDLHNRISCSS